MTKTEETYVKAVELARTICRLHTETRGKQVGALTLDDLARLQDAITTVRACLIVAMSLLYPDFTEAQRWEPTREAILAIGGPNVSLSKWRNTLRRFSAYFWALDKFSPTNEWARVTMDFLDSQT